MRKAQRKRMRLFNRDGGRCQICSVDMILCPGAGMLPHTPKEYATIDHIVPKSKGGPDGLHNLRLLCLRCNERLGDAGSVRTARNRRMRHMKAAARRKRKAALRHAQRERGGAA